MSLPGLEPELEQRPDDAACAVTLQIDRDELAAVRITGDEQRTDDLALLRPASIRSSAPTKRPSKPAFGPNR